MNRTPRLSLPAARYLVRVQDPAMLGGGTFLRGPFAHYADARRAASAELAPYPGSYAPSVRIIREEVAA